MTVASRWLAQAIQGRAEKGQSAALGNCYIFNPANGVLTVTVNNVNLGPIAPADPDSGYEPQSMTVTTTRHDDGDGTIAIADPNVISLYYPEDPNQQYGPYAAQLCFRGLQISVDDDIVIYAGRPVAGGQPSVTTMNKRGFVLDTRCSPSAPSLGGARQKGAA